VCSSDLYEAINYGWHRWVLNFQDRQNDFLQQLLGGISVVKIVLLILITGGLVLLAVAGSLFIRRGPRQDPLISALKRLDKRLLQFGLQRHSGEPPGQFFARMEQSFPSLSEEFAALSRCYEQISYAEDSDPEQLAQFRRLMSRCCSLIPQNKSL